MEGAGWTRAPKEPPMPTADERTSAKITAIRTKAGNPGVKCPICTREAAAPARRRDANGRIVEGCVDAFHTGALYGESRAWHDRPGAVKLRAAELAWLKTH